MAPFGWAREAELIDTSADAQLNLIVRQSIVPVSFWMGVLFAFFSISHWLVLPKEVAAVMSLLAACSAAVLFALHLIARRGLITPSWAHPVAVGVSALAFLNALVHMALTRDILQSTDVMLIFVGVGFFILSAGWYWLAILIGLGGWILTAAQIPGSENKIHFTFGIFTAIVLSAIVHVAHVQTIKSWAKSSTDENRSRLELSALNSIIASITSSREPERVFQKIVDAVQHFIPQASGALLQELEGRDTLVARAWTNSMEPQVFTSYSGEDVAGLAVSERNLINVPNIKDDPRFASYARASNSLSVLAMPLLVGERVVGVISLEGRARDSFGAQEERKIKLLAGYAAVAIENARLYSEYALAEETLKNYTDHLQDVVESRTSELRTAQDKLFAQRGLEQEIDLARQVQASLLAQDIPVFDGYVFAATAIPARYVGGDFYDFIPKGNSCSVILADISGKGIPAAMLTSTARTLVRAAMKYESEPALILSNMQDAIYPDLSHAEMFGTFFAAALEPAAARLKYANAGHTQGVWWKYRTRSVDLLAATGLPIGIIPNNEITQKEILLSPGDMLVLYSDGVTETQNTDGNLFGLERLLELIKANSDDTAHTLAQRILTVADNFASGAPLADDLTLVVLKVLPRVIPFRYAAHLDQLEFVVAFIRAQVQMYGSDFAYQIELAASELVTNIIKYAYRDAAGEIRGDIAIEREKVVLDLFDRGAPFDFSTLTPVDLSSPHSGGYGLHIVRQLVDELDYTAGTESENHWRVAKKLPGIAA